MAIMRFFFSQRQFDFVHLVRGFNSEEEMIDKLQGTEIKTTFLAGIAFDDSIFYEDKSVPQHIKVSFRIDNYRIFLGAKKKK